MHIISLLTLCESYYDSMTLVIIPNTRVFPLFRAIVSSTSTTSSVTIDSTADSLNLIGKQTMNNKQKLSTKDGGEKNKVIRGFKYSMRRCADFFFKGIRKLNLASTKFKNRAFQFPNTKLCSLFVDIREEGGV